jgi:multicomponent Na+:H+ antiporter subunit G
MEHLISILLDLLIGAFLLAGLFFMVVGALGLVRFPDFYCRSHAASKCVTLGVVGLLAALVLSMSDAGHEGGTGVLTRALLAVAFILIAAPIGSHMLARAAHRAHVKPWHRTAGDELSEDTGERTG